MQFTLATASLKETNSYGFKLGSQLKGGELIQLVGDVGAGKTAFVRSLVHGAGSKDNVSSPTFTICNTYYGKFQIHHCDFYRLHSDQLIDKELEELIDGKAVIVLEWAENIKPLTDVPFITIKILVEANDARKFEFTVPDAYNYISL